VQKYGKFPCILHEVDVKKWSESIKKRWICESVIYMRYWYNMSWKICKECFGKCTLEYTQLYKKMKQKIDHCVRKMLKNTFCLIEKRMWRLCEDVFWLKSFSCEKLELFCEKVNFIPLYIVCIYFSDNRILICLVGTVRKKKIYV